MLPRGVLVGTVNLRNSRPAQAEDAVAACIPAELLSGQYSWELQEPHRFEVPLNVQFRPYGVWFYPFQRKQ